MITLKNIPSRVAEVVNASAYFTTAPAVLCIEDNGLKDGEIETQLRTKGAVVVVRPLTRGSRRDIGGKKLVFDCEVLVQCLLNPTVNFATGAANRQMLEMVSAVVAAVLSWQPTAGDREFQTSEEFLQLSVSDEGLLCYDLFFTKLATIN